MAIDDPNVVLPLAVSYNERGVAGYTHTVTNGEDQRKINSFYEISKNSVTGKGSLTLSKRPGVTVDSLTYGSSSQIAYLTINADIPEDRTVFNTLSGNIRSSVSLHNVTILASSTSYPMYVDTTTISKVRNIILQIGVLQGGSDSSGATYFISKSDLIAGSAWTQITDGDYTSNTYVGKMEHMDGFAFILDGNGVIWNSDNNSIANWTSSSFITKGIQQDGAIGLARLNLKLLAFGTQSVEVFYNAGNTVGSPLGRIPQLAANVGLVQTVRNATSAAAGGGTHYYATLENALYFVGNKGGVKTGTGDSNAGFYVFDGQNFEKISSNYIDKILSQESEANSIYSVNTINIQGQSGIAVCFSAPSAATQRSLVFFPEWKEWFEWTSTVFSPVNGGGYHIGVSDSSKLFYFGTSDNWQDAGTSYQWLTQFRLPTNGSSQKRMLMYGVDADTDTSASSISVDVSDDDCQSFKSLQSIDLTRERKINFRGGSYTRRHVRLSATDARPKRIANFIANVSD